MNYSAELNVVIQCCSFSDGIGQPDNIPRNIQPENISWKSVIFLAQQHKVIFQVYNALKHGYPAEPPRDVMLQLKKDAAVYSIHTKLISDAMFEIIPALRQKGIRVMVLKGPALSLLLYNKPDERQYRDLDLYIERDDFIRSIPIIKSLGYEIITPENDIPVFNENLPGAKGHHLVFMNKTDAVIIEVHSGFYLSENDLFLANNDNFIWHEKTIIFNSKEIAVPDDYDHWIFILCHGTRHEWCTLRWIMDWLLIIKKTGPEGFSSLWLQITEYGLERACALACEQANRVFSAEIPAEVENYISKNRRVVKKLADYTGRVLSDSRLLKPTTFHTMRNYWWYMPKIVRGFRRRVKLILFPLHPCDDDFKILKLPENFYYLVMLLRPVAVILRKLKQKKADSGEPSV